MKKIILFAMFVHCLYGQDIKVSDKKFTTLVFNSNISNCLIGNEDFLLEYSEDSPDKIALIKAKSSLSEETSLVVKTDNGFIFNLNLSYNKEAKNILKIEDTLGLQINKPSIEVKQNSSEKQQSYGTVKNSVKTDDYLQNIKTETDCEYCNLYLSQPKEIKSLFKENNSIKIQLYNIFYKDEKLYFLINLENKSNVDYNVNFLKTFVNISNSDKSSSSQYLETSPLLRYNYENTIKGKENRKLLLVYEKFTIDKSKKFTIEINESNGDRNISLDIPFYLINNPKKI